METMTETTRMSRQNSRRERIRRYTKQSDSLPEALRMQLKSWGDVVAYALMDLNASYQLEESWLVWTTGSLLHAQWTQDQWHVQAWSRSDLGGVEEVPGLSCNRMIVYGKEKEQTCVVVRYSHRQAKAVGVIRFLIEQDVKRRQNDLAIDLEIKPGRADELYAENVLHSITEEQASSSGQRLAVIWRLLSYLKPYRTQVTLGGIGAVLMTLVSLVPAFLTGYIVDHVIKPFQAGQVDRAAAMDLAWVAIAGLLSVYLVREAFAWVRLKTMSILGEYVARDLREEAYEHLHRLSMTFFNSKQTGSLISRIGSDTDRIWDFVAFGVVEVMTALMMLTGLSVVLITLDVPLGLAVTVPVPFLLWAIFRHGQKMQALFLRAWRKWSNLTDCLSDTIPGVRVVKAFNREQYETRRFKERNRAVVNEFNNIHRVWTSFWPVLMLSIHAVVVTVWVFGVPRVLEHIEALSVNPAAAETVGLSPGTFVAFVLYLTMFTQPIEIIGQMARMVNRATSSAHRVFEVIDTEPRVLNIGNPVRLEPMQGAVEFENVTFSYDGIRKVLKGICFSVKPGEMIGLVGSSGSGKTTIINLLARFYDVEDGRICVDGVDLKDLDLANYRQQVGMVLQDPYLFHGSILDNIRYAKPEAGLDEVLEAARAANAHDFICRLPHAYDTVVGERGHTLSGGERQRVSIARAILRNPRILILDEATSAVDTETERKIQEALDRLVAGRTVFAIAHRLSTLNKADRIFVVKEGELVEQGTAAALMNIENGVYRKLVDMQKELQSTTLV